MTLSKELLEILVCPKCKGAVTVVAEAAIVCDGCRLQYPIRDGIPVMLLDEAETIS